MDVSGVMALAGQFGPMGLLVAYLVWREGRDEKRRQLEVDARLDVDRETNEERAKLTSALMSLCMAVGGRPNV